MVESMEAETKQVSVTSSVDNCHASSNSQRVSVHARKRRKRRGLLELPHHHLFFWTILALGYIITVCMAQTAEDPSPPTIVSPVESPIVERGQVLTLTCHGDLRLEWTYPNNDSKPRLNITHVERADGRRYSSTLTLRNVGISDIGYYTCRYEQKSEESNSSLEDPNETLIYVYVKDERHLLTSREIEYIHAYPGTTFTIPCRPAWPEVNITLSIGTQQISLETGNYDIKEGLRIDNVKLQDHGNYDCKGTYNGGGKQHSSISKFQFFVREPSHQIINPPRMNITKKGSITIGEEFEVLCVTEQSQSFLFKLDLAEPLTMDRSDPSRVNVSEGSLPTTSRGTKAWFKRMIIRNAQKGDEGIYTCTVTSVSRPITKKTTIKRVKVFDEGESFLEVFAEVENITVRENGLARWIVNISSHPLHHDFSWQDYTGKEIYSDNVKYVIKRTPNREDEHILEIYNVTLEDAGVYPFIATIYGFNIEDSTKRLNLSLTVKGPPKARIESTKAQNYFIADEEYRLFCYARGYPQPKVTWTYQECTDFSKCSEPKEVNEASHQDEKLKNGTLSTLPFVANSHGIYTCNAKNPFGSDSFSKRITVVDYSGDANMVIIQPDEIVDGDYVTISCALSKMHDGKSISWSQLDVNGDEVPLDPEIAERESESRWSTKKTLEFKNIKPSLNGTYVCNSGGNTPLTINTTLNVLDIIPPQLTRTSLNNTKVSLKKGDQINLTCKASGRPKPALIWTWDGYREEDWSKIVSDLKYAFTPDRTSLVLSYVPPDAAGRFACTAENRNGTVSAYMDIAVAGDRAFSNLAVGLIVSLLLLLIIFGLILARYKYRQGKIRRYLKGLTQKEFYEGAVENINPDLSVTDQAYLLPFDTTWEFPKDRLKLGIQLGSGAFGRVVKAEAFGILDTESRTTVAVKMVKPNADESHFKALMSELKIMVHLGKHINVVNLLGACTANLAKKNELLVIVEYCKYGSVLSYMHRNRRTFINQLDPAKGVIDPNIYRRVDCNSQQSQPNPRLQYATLTFADPGNSRKPASNGYRTLEELDPPTPTPQPVEVGNGYPPPQSPTGYLTPNRRSTEHYVAESQVESVCTDMSYLSNGRSMVNTDGTTKRRSSCGSQWQDHYRGDYQMNEVRHIKTTDLLCWAFQIARGMEYLATRKVLHGDLAARNVLLTEDNIVKICDFGLAKEMYKDYKYKKKSEGVLLPVKWMAIESIYFGVFSTQSDCWSFGVVLWELFTLGKTPYPGMEADERFYNRISEGYRMEKPPLAPSCVYDIMLECWAREPTERPNFTTLVDRIGDMMEEGLRNHYVDLNAAYLKINQAYMSGRTDYLLQMGRSEFASTSERSSPDRKYQNVPEEMDSAGYLKPLPGPSSSVPPQSPPPVSPQYQNVERAAGGVDEPSCAMLANNSGYMFVKAPVDFHGPGPNGQQQQQQQHSEEENSTQPQCKIQISYSPDIKDLYGLRADSTSPDRNSLSEFNAENGLEDEGQMDASNSGPVILGSDGIRGVDNMNYVPNHLLFTNNKRAAEGSLPNGGVLREGKAAELEEENPPHSRSNSGRQTRQKNDSGLGSIDSNQFEVHQHNNKTDSQQQQCASDFSSQLQEPNGYVRHQNISSFS